MAVPWKGNPGRQKPSKWRKTIVKIMVKIGHFFIKTLPDFFSMQTACGYRITPVNVTIFTCINPNTIPYHYY